MSYGLWRGHNLFEAMRHRLPSQDSGVMARALSVTSLRCAPADRLSYDGHGSRPCTR